MKNLFVVLFVCVVTPMLKGDVISAAGPGVFDSDVPLISQANFSDDELIVDIDIEIKGLEYPWAGDLTFTVTSPIGSRFNLIRRLGKSDFESATDSGSSIDYRGDYTFSDDGGDIDIARQGVNVLPPGDYFATTTQGERVSLVETIGYESTAGTWTLLVEDFDDEDGGKIDGWAISTRSVANPECDFNGDQVCNIDDLDGPDGLYQVGDLVAGTVVTSEIDANARFDILEDGRIDVGDLNLWRGAAAHRNGFAQAYKLGDLDLDGTVGFSDFLQLSAGFGRGVRWGEGNLRGSGATEFSDFLSLSGHFGVELIRKPAQGASVPEPSRAYMVSFAAVLFWLASNRRINLTEPHELVPSENLPRDHAKVD